MSLYQEGCPLSYIQQMLGHENISTTSDFYDFVTLDILAKGMERINPEKENTGKNWKDEKIAETLYRFRDSTTNIIEGLNRQYQKVTKTKSVFPSDTSLEKMLYLASENVVKKWTQRYRNWDQVLNQLIVLYDERITNYLLTKKRDGIIFIIWIFTIIILQVLIIIF